MEPRYSLSFEGHGEARAVVTLRSWRQGASLTLLYTDGGGAAAAAAGDAAGPAPRTLLAVRGARLERDRSQLGRLTFELAEAEPEGGAGAGAEGGGRFSFSASAPSTLFAFPLRFGCAAYAPRPPPPLPPPPSPHRPPPLSPPLPPPPPPPLSPPLAVMLEERSTALWRAGRELLGGLLRDASGRRLLGLCLAALLLLLACSRLLRCPCAPSQYRHLPGDSDWDAQRTTRRSGAARLAAKMGLD